MEKLKKESKIGGRKMEENQRINCSVSSCKYNNQKDQLCQLKQIVVTPIQGIETKQADESMCSSYKNANQNRF